MELTGQTQKSSTLLASLEQLKSSRITRQKVNVAVIAIERYLAQNNVDAEPDILPDCYSYDVTVTDGIWQVKCKLSPGLHKLVHRNILRSGIDVRISELALIYDERRLGQSFVRIEDLECSSNVSDVFRSVKEVDGLSTWAANDAFPFRPNTPLDTDRKHYLSLWNNEDPYGSVWIPNRPPADVVFDLTKIWMVAHVEMMYFRGRQLPPLLVRVMHKSRLRYYGKPSKNVDFPYQAYFEVADQSGIISMVLWNALCVDWYHRLHIGTELYIGGYALKKAYQQRSRPHINSSLTVFHSTEISLNPEYAILSIIPPRKVQPEWCLPEVPFLFHNRVEIEQLTHHTVVDVVGLVTFVGRVERVRSSGNTAHERFWTYRWVHAIDGTSDSPFILEIFSNSQPEMFNSIHPMTLLVCTQMRVCCESGTHRYLTSSAETQIFNSGSHKNQPYQTQPKVKAFIQWLKTKQDRDMLTRCAVGGHYCFPSPPPNLTLSTDQNSGQQLLALEDLKKELESLQYRERKTVLIQGHIVAVRHYTWPSRTAAHSQNALQEEDTLECAASTGLAADPEQQDVESEGQSEGHDMERDSPGLSEGSSTGTHKRRRAMQLKRTVKRHYITRATAQSQREMSSDEADVDEGGDEEHREEDVENTGHPAPTADSSLENNPLLPETDRSSSAGGPNAFWESSVLSATAASSSSEALGTREHILQLGGGPLQQDSVAECFCFDDRDFHLRGVNLHPSRWSPELFPPEHASHPAAACDGYYTLSILGLNQQVAVDALFLPVWSSKDPRTSGMSWAHHDNSLLSCLMANHFCPPPNTADGTDSPRPRPEELMASAAALEREHLVCVLELCLLGDGKAEVVCSRVYRASDVISNPQTSGAL